MLLAASRATAGIPSDVRGHSSGLCSDALDTVLPLTVSFETRTPGASPPLTAAWGALGAGLNRLAVPGRDA